MKPILAVLHQPTTDTGRVGQLLKSYGYQLDICLPCLGEALPSSLDHHEGVIIFGGPMSANDQDILPYIRTELNWIPTVLESEKPYFGICLGAQLLAKVLGANVREHPHEIKEIGYFPITPTVEGKDCFQSFQYVYQWHREGFELPQDAVLLATGQTFKNQAFRYGKSAYGVQFHPEMTGELMQRWLERGLEQLTSPGAQSKTEQLRKHALYGQQAETWLKTFLPLWLNRPDLQSCYDTERRTA